MAEIQGYCMKCREKRIIKDGEVTEMGKAGRKAYKGLCPDCGTKMFKILSADDKKSLGI